MVTMLLSVCTIPIKTIKRTATIRICLGDMSFFRDVVGWGRLKKHFGFSDDLSSIYKA